MGIHVANLNDFVEVKLTDHGKEVLRNYQISHHWPVNENREVYQLWHLMEIFGAHLYLGGKQIFESNEILLEDWGD